MHNSYLVQNAKYIGFSLKKIISTCCNFFKFNFESTARIIFLEENENYVLLSYFFVLFYVPLCYKTIHLSIL